MYIKKSFFYLLFLFFPFSLSAHPYLCGVGVQAELIHFKPSFTNGVVAVGVGSDLDSAKAIYSKDDWENGYRISLNGIFVSTFFQLSYLHLDFKESFGKVETLRTKASDELSYYVYQARHSYLNEYQGLFNYAICKSRCFSLLFEGGINYVDLSLFEFNNSELIVDPFDAQAELNESYWGIGPQIGWKWIVNFFPWFALENSFRAALLSGENQFDSKVAFTNLTEQQLSRLNFGNYSSPSHAHIVPMGQMKLGLAVFSPCTLIGVTLGLRAEIGYEIQYFHQILLEQPKIAETIHRSFSWQGIYLSFALYF